jgi:transposase
LLADYHIICAKGAHIIYKQLPLIIEDAEKPLTFTAGTFFQEMYIELAALESRVQETIDLSHGLLKHDNDYNRIQQIPGIGPIIAAKTIAAINTGKQFKNGWQFDTWLGITPKHYAGDERCYMDKISNHANKRLRTLLIHGVRIPLKMIALCD